MYIESSSNFLLILHWGYSVLGAIIHLAVKGSLSAMHTRVVHGVWDQSQNVREWLCFQLKRCCWSFIKSHQWQQTMQQGRVLLSEVGRTNSVSTKTGMSQWPWHRPCGHYGLFHNISEIPCEVPAVWQPSQNECISTTLTKPGNTELRNLKLCSHQVVEQHPTLTHYNTILL